MDNFKDKTAFITGGAAGIGAGLSSILNLGLDTVLGPAQIGTPGG